MKISSLSPDCNNEYFYLYRENVEIRLWNKYYRIKRRLYEKINRKYKTILFRYVIMLLRLGKSMGELSQEMQIPIEKMQKLHAEVELLKKICRELREGKDDEAIANETEEDPVKIRRITAVAREYAPEYEEEKIFEAIYGRIPGGEKELR